MSGKGNGVEKASNGLCRKIDFSDAFRDDAEDSAATDRYKNEVSREELLVGRVGECTAAFTVNFGWYDLEKHIGIIA